MLLNDQRWPYQKRTCIDFSNLMRNGWWDGGRVVVDRMVRSGSEMAGIPTYGSRDWPELSIYLCLTD